MPAVCLEILIIQRILVYQGVLTINGKMETELLRENKEKS